LLSLRDGAIGELDLSLPLTGIGGGPGGRTSGIGGCNGLPPFIGAPQFGHAVADMLTSCPHSKHFVSAILKYDSRKNFAAASNATFGKIANRDQENSVIQELPRFFSCEVSYH
jgi:hypothetical protein